jgi:hypothetical protein
MTGDFVALESSKSTLDGLLWELDIRKLGV